MAKKSIVDKNNKLLIGIQSHKEFRNKIINALHTNDDVEEKIRLMKILDKTRRFSAIRYRNRCKITGRPRGYRGGVGLCRGALRHYASFGLIAGLKKN